jgi:glycosyltransferase involved in cell wall biosynthesis
LEKKFLIRFSGIPINQKATRFAECIINCIFVDRNQRMKKVIVSVTSDLCTDRRVHRTCMVLHDMGFDVLLIGRKLSKSDVLEMRPYKTKRMHLLFEKGPMFYATYNFALFFKLLFRKVDFLVANDLDTLFANYLVSRIRRKKIIYDSHEYFTGVPELAGRTFVKGFWKRIERLAFPKLSEIITVNSSIAGLYEAEYNRKLSIVRNIPSLKKPEKIYSRRELGISEDKAMIILQGAGINIDRGAEEAVMAMKYVDNAVLYIVGDGDVVSLLKEISTKENLDEKVKFIPKQPFDLFYSYTACADLGLTLDKDTNINYRFSLPNKLFDYIHAGVPVLATALPEIKNIIQQYKVGDFIENHDPEHIAAQINTMLVDKQRMNFYRENCKFASAELNWENERTNLENIFKKYI